jgi:hypothetical protein
MVFWPKTGSGKRFAVLASFTSVSIGLFLAAFQVQGSHMPHDVALALDSFLGLMIVAAVVAMGWEAFKFVRGYLEHRATSASYVSSEEPGLLDYEADGMRANKRFTRELNKLARQTATLNRRLERHTKRAARLVGKSAKRRQRHANRSARSVSRNAVFVAKRLDLFEALVKDIATTRNTHGLAVSVLNPETREEIDATKTFQATLKGTHEITQGTIKSTEEYRRSVQDIEDQNLSRTMRIASNALGSALDGVIGTLRQHDVEAVKAIGVLGKKINAAERKLKQS